MSKNLKNDKKLLIRPSILIATCLMSVLSISYINNAREDVYVSTAMNYQKYNTIPTANTEIKLSKAELVDKSNIKLTFNKENMSFYTDVMATKKLFIKIFDGEGNNLITKEIKNNVEVIDIELTDDFVSKALLNETNNYYTDLTINYYYTDTDDTLTFADPFSETTLKYSDLFVYEDLSNYYDKNKSEKEIDSEVNYIQKYYLNNEFIQQLLSREDVNIKRIANKTIEEQHAEYGKIAKDIKAKYSTYYQLLIKKGISKQEINSIINSPDDLNAKISNLKNLTSKADDLMEQKLSGYKKELNTNYAYSVDKLNSLCEGKSSLEQIDILEKEINKYKNDKITSEDIKNQVKKLNSQKVDKKKIQIITQNKSLTNSQKLSKLIVLDKK